MRARARPRACLRGPRAARARRTRRSRGGRRSPPATARSSCGRASAWGCGGWAHTPRRQCVLPRPASGATSSRADPMTRRRLAAVAALALATATAVLALAVAVANFPRGILVLACLALAVALAWYGIRRRGAARVIGLVGA